MQSEIEYYINLSKKVLNEEDKINFFDQYQKEFYLDIYSDNWSNMMAAYAKEECLSSEQLNKIEEMKWKYMPRALKKFVYEFSILTGFVYTGVDK